MFPEIDSGLFCVDVLRVVEEQTSVEGFFSLPDKLCSLHCNTAGYKSFEGQSLGVISA